MTYRVFLSEKAQHDLDRLPAKFADPIIADCLCLVDDPVPPLPHQRLGSAHDRAWSLVFPGLAGRGVGGAQYVERY